MEDHVRRFLEYEFIELKYLDPVHIKILCENRTDKVEDLLLKGLRKGAIQHLTINDLNYFTLQN